MDPIAQFISTLMSSREQAQVFHWQVIGPGSDAAHRALGAYYEGIGELMDGLVESYQGRNGIIKGYSQALPFKEDGSYLTYFENLCKYVELIRTKITQDSYIQNQVDEIVDLIETTKYKLKFLQ